MKIIIVRLGMGLGLLLVSGFLVLAGWASDQLLKPPRRPLQNYHQQILSAPTAHGLQIERYTGPRATPCLMVTPCRHPGVAKRGREVRKELAKSKESLPAWGEIRGTVLLLHGFRGRKEDHLPIAERLCSVGFRCLIPDLPAHGDQPPSTATFGFKEAGLPREILEDAARRFHFDPEPSGLLGVSQGGAIAIFAAAEENAPWRAVGSISAFSRLSQPVASAATQYRPKLARLTPLASTACGFGVYCREGFMFSDIRPVDAAARIHIPALIVHGEQDHFIPYSSGCELFEAIASEEKIFRPVAGAGHGNIFVVGSTPLHADVCRFFLHHLPPHSEAPLTKDRISRN